MEDISRKLPQMILVQLKAVQFARFHYAVEWPLANAPKAAQRSRIQFTLAYPQIRSTVSNEFGLLSEIMGWQKRENFPATSAAQNQISTGPREGQCVNSCFHKINWMKAQSLSKPMLFGSLEIFIDLDFFEFRD